MALRYFADDVILPRDAMLAWHMLLSRVRLSVRPSVYLSVCLRQVGVLLKRLNVGSRKQRRMIAQGLYSFLVAKVCAKFELGHP